MEQLFLWQGVRRSWSRGSRPCHGPSHDCASWCREVRLRSSTTPAQAIMRSRCLLVKKAYLLRWRLLTDKWPTQNIQRFGSTARRDTFVLPLLPLEFLRRRCRSSWSTSSAWQMSSKRFSGMVRQAASRGRTRSPWPRPRPTSRARGSSGSRGWPAAVGRLGAPDAGIGPARTRARRLVRTGRGVVPARRTPPERGMLATV